MATQRKLTQRPGGPTDMAYKQFMDALSRHGMTWVGILGYVELGNGCSVSILNCPKKSNRARLAFLLAAQEKEIERRAS